MKTAIGSRKMIITTPTIAWMMVFLNGCDEGVSPYVDPDSVAAKIDQKQEFELGGFWQVENTLLFFDEKSEDSGVAKVIRLMDGSVSMSSRAWKVTELKAFRGLLPDALLELEEIYIGHQRQGGDHQMVTDRVYRFTESETLFFLSKSEGREEIIEDNGPGNDVGIEVYTRFTE